MSLCPSCAVAAVNAATHSFHANCHECSVRALSHGQDFFFSKRDGAMTPAYRAALVVLFGPSNEQIKAGHARVKACAEKITAARQGMAHG